jgi:hypothetical protein
MTSLPIPRYLEDYVNLTSYIHGHNCIHTQTCDQSHQTGKLVIVVPITISPEPNKVYRVACWSSLSNVPIREPGDCNSKFLLAYGVLGQWI